MFARRLLRRTAECCLALTLAVVGLSGPVTAEEVNGVAVVIDGDTLVVDGMRFDLFALDAPEPEQVCEADGKLWACGEDAARVLSCIIAGRLVSCKAIGTNAEGVALSPPDGPAINTAEEAAAKAYPRGLWASRFVPPWEWREGRRLVPAPGGG